MLEDHELQARRASQSHHGSAMLLWLKCIRLFYEAFSQEIDWSDEDNDTVAERNVRMNLLGLAGTSSKPTLDALLAGYYSTAYGLIRTSLETWRRESSIRLAPAQALGYFEMPLESPVDETGKPRKNRNMGLPYKVIQDIFDLHAREDERERLEYINAGIIHMHAGAHPSAESMAQLFNQRDPARRNYGPTYNHALCAFGFRWGLTAQISLLQEIQLLKKQSVHWGKDFDRLEAGFLAWADTDEALLHDPFD